MKYFDLTDRILRCYYTVYNTLGRGFLEKVYHNALALELINQGMEIEQQAQIKVYYAGEVVGEYFADILVEKKILLELKAIDALTAKEDAQLINYLKATEVEVGLLLNFGAPSPQIKRRHYPNVEKQSLFQ